MYNVHINVEPINDDISKTMKEKQRSECNLIELNLFVYIIAQKYWIQLRIHRNDSSVKIIIIQLVAVE